MTTATAHRQRHFRTHSSEREKSPKIGNDRLRPYTKFNFVILLQAKLSD